MIRFPWTKKGGEETSDEDRGTVDLALEKVAADVEEYGWHLLLISGDEGSTGFLYTVGLWSTFQHPELLLFSTGSDPTKLAGYVDRMVKAIAAGERYEPGRRYDGAFGKFSGAVREIDPRWYPHFLGTGGAHYGHFDFPAVQLFWPDAEGRFPWESEFDLPLVDRQPLLFNANPLLANLPREESAALLEDDGETPFREGLEELCVPLTDSTTDAVEAWRWLIGDDVRPYRLTCFGDLLLVDSSGRFHFLGCGFGECFEIAPDEASLWPVLALKAELAFHRRLLLHIREIGWEIPAGQVFSLEQSPQLGGAENLHNLGYAPPSVHIVHAARTSRELAEA